MRFSELLMEDRIRILSQERDITVFYDLLQKHLGGTIDSLKDKYTLTPDFFMNRVTISGSMSDIFDLFNYLNRFNVPFESVTPTSLRIDIYKFLYKIR